MHKQQHLPQRSSNGDVLLFARNFFRHPRMLGSIVPSSRFLIKQLLEPINFGRARVIVEYGPGVGGITTEFLRHMRADAALIAIEMNPDFVRHLRETISDKRLRVVEGSAAQVDEILRRVGFLRADYIVSGIPSAPSTHRSGSRSCARPTTCSSPGVRFWCTSSRRACCRICGGCLATSGASFSPGTCCRRTCSSASPPRPSAPTPGPRRAACAAVPRRSRPPGSSPAS